MLITHKQPHSQAARPVVAPVASIGATVAALAIIRAGSLAAVFAAEQRK